MRGKDQLFGVIFSSEGITPAYAGKSSASCAAHQPRKDHPRLCGEKFGWRGVRLNRAGSPPPMRGKGAEHRLLRSEIGITPAYAGKSVVDYDKKTGK